MNKINIYNKLIYWINDNLNLREFFTLLIIVEQINIIYLKVFHAAQRHRAPRIEGP